MEEVKEKPLSQKRAEAIERGKELTDKCDIKNKIPHANDTNVAHSILEKLREELARMDRLLEEMESFCSSDYIDGRKFQLNEISDFLTALETTQFTPWQEIEVSDDWIDWVHSKFVDMYEGKYRVNNTSEDFPSMRTYWNNARPIKIEPELPSVPKFEWLEIIEDCAEKSSGKEWEYDKYLIDALGDQLEILTTFCQALARQKTTK